MLGPVTEVSNISRSVTLAPAGLAQQRAALSLILAPSDRLAGENEISEFLRVADGRKIDLARLHVAVGGNRLLWAALPIPSPGRTLLLLAPNYFIDQAQVAAAEFLTQFLCAQYRDCHLAQLLVEPSSRNLRTVYQRAGFMEIAELAYLQTAARKPKISPALPEDYYFENYASANHELFATAIRESYEQSLDCPALSKLRDIEDVILGHKAAGGAGADVMPSGELWRVLMQRRAGPLGPAPCGVLLLCRTDGQTMELVYIGLAPHARRRGLGTILVQMALATAAEENRRLTLAVDSLNQPAVRLYYRLGFQKVGAKVAMIRDLRTGNGGEK